MAQFSTHYVERVSEGWKGLAASTLCGRDSNIVDRSPHRYAVTCKRCKRLLSKKPPSEDSR